jgi:hypothetical protein
MSDLARSVTEACDKFQEKTRLLTLSGRSAYASAQIPLVIIMGAVVVWRIEVLVRFMVVGCDGLH